MRRRATSGATGTHVAGRAVLVAFIAACVGAPLLATAGWACVPQPLVVVRPAASGPPASQVTVDGLAIPGSVEIRWNGVDGPKLATAGGPTFSVPVTIPQVPDGLYVVLAVARGSDGSVGATGRASFLVTSAEDGTARVPLTSPQAPSTVERGGSSAPTPLVLAAGGALGLLGALAGAAFAGRRRPAPGVDGGPAAAP